MTTRVGISRLHFPVTTLGPGRRIGIWFQGCSIRCSGCISADTWGQADVKESIETLLSRIEAWLPEADGVTVSGGEPFDQPDALFALLRAIRKGSSVDVLVYTGYPFEVVASRLPEAAGLIDALVTDPFDERVPQSLALRGSDNQQLHLLTPVGIARFAAFNLPNTSDARSLDIMFDDNGAVWLAGIPRRGDLARLRHLLEEQGHIVVTSDDRSGSVR
jgi:anaerobic ribonucleoside-triphosphate reductase activating protein